MITKKQVEKEFRAELQDILNKWGAEISAEDHFTGYSECGEDIRMTVTIPNIYDKDTCDTIREYAEINLGRYMDAEKKS